DFRTKHGISLADRRRSTLFRRLPPRSDILKSPVVVLKSLKRRDFPDRHGLGGLVSPWRGEKLGLTVPQGRLRDACFSGARSNGGANDRSLPHPLRRGAKEGLPQRRPAGESGPRIRPPKIRDGQEKKVAPPAGTCPRRRCDLGRKRGADTRAEDDL